MAFLLAAILSGLIWVLFGSHRILHPIRYKPAVTPEDFGLAWESFRLRTADQVDVSTWLIRHPRPEGLLLLLHGFGSSKAELLDIAQAFHACSPYHLLLLDLRGHGESGGRTATFGFREMLEIQAVLDFIARDPDLKGLPVGCYGVSMGGAISLLAAARFPNIRAVVSDSAYADFGKAVARVQWLTYHIPRIPLGLGTLWVTELRLGCRASTLSPVQMIRALSPRAVLIIHGMQDFTVPSEEARVLFEAAGTAKELWLVPEAEHAACYYKRKEEYPLKVKEFFRDAFLRAA